MYKLLFLSLLVLLSGCSSKYKLFQEDRESTDSISETKEPGFLNGIFPKKEIQLDSTKHRYKQTKENYPLNFQYTSKILAGDTLKIDVYNRSRRISLEQINDLNTESALTSIKPTKQEYVVDMDGTLYLPIINEVNFQGLTGRSDGTVETNGETLFT